MAAEDLAFEEAARLYRQALIVGREEISETERGRLELALARVLYRSGDLPGWHDSVIGVARRAERRGDRLLLARAALEMDATGGTEWDSEICRICEQALAGSGLADEVRARVLARYAQALVYRGEYGRGAEVSREALDAAERAGDPAAVVDALRARQLACSGPEGSGERAALAARMLDVAGQVRDAWVEMWGRLWRIDTLFEAGLLAQIPPRMGPGGSDAGNSLASVFPALNLALMWLERGDRDSAAGCTSRPARSARGAHCPRCG